MQLKRFLPLAHPVERGLEAARRRLIWDLGRPCGLNTWANQVGDGQYKDYRPLKGSRDEDLQSCDMPLPRHTSRRYHTIGASVMKRGF